ncbi:MAG TPA: hypothetical protein VJ953_09725 [Saprospiraceae bacterium]|nr:hypothetical protein [Saprospiraceae bacterium]
MTRQELATLYGIHRRTLARWMKAEGIIIKRRLLRPKDLQIIYAKLGNPDNQEAKE